MICFSFFKISSLHFYNIKSNFKNGFDLIPGKKDPVINIVNYFLHHKKSSALIYLMLDNIHRIIPMIPHIMNRFIYCFWLENSRCSVHNLIIVIFYARLNNRLAFSKPCCHGFKCSNLGRRL